MVKQEKRLDKTKTKTKTNKQRGSKDRNRESKIEEMNDELKFFKKDERFLC